jgi:CheY-like chemotaxis protein
MAEVQEHEVILRIEDSGIGIEPGMLNRIFDPFTQANRSLDRSLGGLGIGLALVRNLVEMHGGSVQAFSEGLGKGSEFVVRLPIIEGPKKTQTTPWKPTAVAVRRVLVVDDNHGAAITLARLLEKFWGHQVKVAHEGIEALAMADEFAPEVVLLDIGLPGLSGYEVAEQMRTRPQLNKTLLVALTGYGQDEDRQRSREAGFDEHLVKPASVVSLQELFMHEKLNGA